MAGEKYRHIFLLGPTRTYGYTSPQGGGREPKIPARDPERHGRYLRRRLEDAWRQAGEHRRAITIAERHGAYLEFSGDPEADLVTKSLEARTSGIRLLNVRRPQDAAGREQVIATVFVPNEKRGHFIRKITAYAEKRTRNGLRRNKSLVESISDIRLAVVESFWQDELEKLPRRQHRWIEVWLRYENNDVIERFHVLLQELGITSSRGAIVFPERAVELIRANGDQVAQIVECSDDIAELRSAKEVAPFFLELENQEQLEWVREILSRTEIEPNDEVAVCVLDSGVNNGHLLLKPILSDKDRHTVQDTWGVHDHNRHGTLMAGTAAYGDLLALLQTQFPVRLTHRLESAKILPPQGKAPNPVELWGYMTAQGLYLAEIAAPHRRRVACLAVTATKSRERGRPSSWSGQLDQLASGSEDGRKRLIIVSAGNIEDGDSWRRYPESNRIDNVHDPGQAWNVLTVGACTWKTEISEKSWASYTAVAPEGGLSPYSTTSAAWPARKWPIKPEVVLEGGNVAAGPNDSITDPDDLKLISTSFEPTRRQFEPFCATSAAAAQAAWMAARIHASYSDAWPETVRGLLVHSARWTPAMKQQFLSGNTRTDVARLLRFCGYGVPDLDSALHSLSNSLTLISQAEMQPFDEKNNRAVSRDMHLYNLPWPSDILLSLGEAQVKMRVTLSYFVEPGPGEVGWQDRYRYASHGLRFDLNGPTESVEEFIQRINVQAREERSAYSRTEGPGSRWLIGNARDMGSIHSDFWQGSAAELSRSNHLVVFPAIGWWRERKHLGRLRKRCRYSLLVTIETPDLEIDIYTAVAVQVGIVSPIEVSTG